MTPNGYDPELFEVGATVFFRRILCEDNEHVPLLFTEFAQEAVDYFLSWIRSNLASLQHVEAVGGAPGLVWCANCGPWIDDDENLDLMTMEREAEADGPIRVRRSDLPARVAQFFQADEDEIVQMSLPWLDLQIRAAQPLPIVLECKMCAE